tara:strand:- start:1729 stop:2079 length:351 start_codon:yes stop_codon:yes gene_type:complete
MSHSYCDAEHTTYIAKTEDLNMDPEHRARYLEINARARAAASARTEPNPLSKQVDGGHYKDMKIQLIEYIHANNIPFAEGCAIKYLTRWRTKGGIKDLEKAKHFIELLIELETRNG